MKKMMLIAALTLTGAMWLAAPAPASAATQADGVKNATTTDMSAQRRKHRRAVRVYRAPRHYAPPRYYGYYGPTYYERPYYRPAPLFFGLGGWW